MTREQELECRYDGRIPEALRRAARRADSQEARHGRAGGARITGVTFKPAAILAAMTRRLEPLLAVAPESLDRDDLARLGFTPAEVDAHGAAALAAAGRNLAAGRAARRA